MNTRISRKAVGGLLSMCLAATASAGTTTATFDFENQATTPAGGVSTLTVANNGLSLTIDRVGQAFDVVDLSALSGTTPFGVRTISPTPPGNNFVNVNFSQPLSSFSVQMGDFGAGITDNLAITAFTGVNGTGTNLGSQSATLALTDINTLAFKTLAISGAGIRSVEFIGGDVGNNSVYYDNFSATFAASGGTGGGSTGVPLPPALFVAPLGALVAWYGARRLRLSAVGK